MYSDVVGWLAEWIPEGLKRFYLRSGAYLLGSLVFIGLISGIVILQRVPPSTKRVLWTLVLLLLFGLGFLIAVLLTDVAHAHVG